MVVNDFNGSFRLESIVKKLNLWIWIEVVKILNLNQCLVMTFVRRFELENSNYCLEWDIWKWDLS